MPKMNQLSKKTQATILRIAAASNMTPERVIRAMLSPSRGGKVTTHLDYGIRKDNSNA